MNPVKFKRIFYARCCADGDMRINEMDLIYEEGPRTFQ